MAKNKKSRLILMKVQLQPLTTWNTQEGGVKYALWGRRPTTAAVIGPLSPSAFWVL